MSAILSLLSSSALGQIFGALFQWLQRKEERASLAEKNRHDEKMQELANSQAIALADKGIEKAIREGETRIEETETQAFVESQKPSTSSIAEALKSWVRTGIVFYLLIVETFVGYSVWRLVGGLDSLPKDETLDLFRTIILESLSLLSFAVGWYFAARGTSFSKRTPKTK